MNAALGLPLKDDMVSTPRASDVHDKVSILKHAFWIQIDHGSWQQDGQRKFEDTPPGGETTDSLDSHSISSSTLLVEDQTK